MTAILRSRTTRFTLFLLALLLLLASMPPSVVRVLAQDAAGTVSVELNSANSTPRNVEDTTQKAIQREYAAAWGNMETALEQNHANLLDQNFVGAARKELGRQIQQQQKSGLATKYVDRGHHVEVSFYSPEGTALELHDTAQFEQQTLDGGKVIHSEQVRQQYIVIFTLVEDRWKVRTLQAIPAV